MKIFLILILTFINTKLTNAQTITQIKIVSAPLSTTSIFRISCDQFSYNFSELKQMFIIKKKKEIAKIESFLSKSKAEKKSEIDVRGQLIISYKKQKSKKICFDQFGVFFDKTNYFENKLLFNFLLEHKLIEW